MTTKTKLCKSVGFLVGVCFGPQEILRIFVTREGFLGLNMYKSPVLGHRVCIRQTPEKSV